MEMLKFTLSGRTACFKKPEVNNYVYFTYGNIHKVALLGIFGAILGLNGYPQIRDFGKSRKQAKVADSYPEFYNRLNGLKISILPWRGFRNGLIPKKVQIFNNSVGYASEEPGGNLVVKEQWLERPKWDICLLIDSKEAEKVKDAVCGRSCVYYPYLGKNDHPADISEIRTYEAKEIPFKMGRLSCLAPKDKATIAPLDYEDMEELDAFVGFKYEEALPYGLDGFTNLYTMKTFLYTDGFVETPGTPVYQLEDGKNIIFY